MPDDRSRVNADDPGQPSIRTAPDQTGQAEPATSTVGLTDEAAQARLAQVGPNEIPEEQRSVLLRLLTYFWGPIPWMIEAAAVLSALVRHWDDFVIIMALLAANGAVGFWEEFQAGNAIAALRSRLAPTARVRRGGTWRTIPAREIVPDDLVRIRIGDIVPADAHLGPGDPIEVDQSALTGESLPVTSETGDLVYSGSIVRRGEIDAVVSATGAQTYFGRTTELVETTRTRSHFQEAVLRIGNYLVVVTLSLVALIVGVSVVRGDPVLTTLQFALVLIVAGIPVAMPTVLSVTMAVGARALAHRRAIVSRLASVEELAGVDVLCSDKTGTLTQNLLTAGEPFVLEDVSVADVMLAAALSSRAEDADPIDQAVLGADGATIPAGYSVTEFVPFDPVHKRTEATATTPDGRTARTSKGAPQVILDLASSGPEVRRRVDEAVDEFAGRGFRSLGVARAESDGPWQFLGVIPLLDPPRPDARETIDATRDLGITVKMVTGDQVAIAREIAREVGLGDRILSADELSGVEETSVDPELERRIEDADGFAQVFPEHKHTLVGVLQRQHHIVGMTGDGVNDAPALKRADAGIAVSGATDAARAAADITLLDPGLGVVVEAIREARRIFQRMTSYAIYRIAETVRVVLFMTFSIIGFHFFPVTAIMIVLIALLNDGAILSIAYDRASFRRRPEAWDMPTVLGVATSLGVAGLIASFGLFILGDRVWDLPRDQLRTLIYLKLSVAGQLTVFLTRTRGPFWQSRPAWVLLGATFGAQSIATLVAVYGFLMTPLGWEWAAVVWAYAAVWWLFNDVVKRATYHVIESRRRTA